MKKLNNCRILMNIKGIEAILIPNSDEYQGEYIPKYAQRLKWLFDFTGSTGLGVITKNKTSLFVDSRYKLQAKIEINNNNITINKLNDNIIAQWIKKNTYYKTVGFDSWIITPKQIHKYIELGIKVKPTNNIIDIIWQKKDKHPKNKIFKLNKKNAEIDSQKKCKNIANNLLINKLNSIIITSPENICWLTNMRSIDIPYSPLILSRAILNNKGILTWFINKKRLLNINFFNHIKYKHPSLFLNKISKIKNYISIDKNKTPAAILHYLYKKQSIIVLKKDPSIIKKAIKNNIEQNNIRTTHRKDAIAKTKFLYWIFKNINKNNIYELSAKTKLILFRNQEKLFHGLSFDTISGYSKNSSIIHYKTTNKTNEKLTKNHLYLIDSGGQYLHGTTDVTRTCCFGNTQEEKKIRFTQVLKGNIAISISRFPQEITGGHLDILARQFLWFSGVNYFHGTGHGVGNFLNVHEGPQSISPHEFYNKFQPGMITSNEPGYYKDNNFGIRIENILLTKKDKQPKDEITMLSFETLTLIPIQLNLIKKNMINDIESNWLNIYHQQIFKTLKFFLNIKEKKWLYEITYSIKN